MLIIPVDKISKPYNTDGTGRYISKTGLGVYHYGEDNAPELALTSVTGSDGTVINQAQQDISYTPFNKVERITQGTKQLEITYGIDQQRKITKLYDGTTLIKKKTFVGGLYEIEEYYTGSIRQLYYIPGPMGEAAIYEKVNPGASQMFYLHKDHQGTYQTITTSAGGTLETLSFDPWGRRRNATDWTYSGIPASFRFNRGYTGHEHLDEFGLINMNGRVYDPAAGAFLSPDILVQNGTSTQSYNRYAYCFNNPLKYTDPSGWEYIPYSREPYGWHGYLNQDRIIQEAWRFNRSSNLQVWASTPAYDFSGFTNEEWIAASNPSPVYMDIYLSNSNGQHSKEFMSYIGISRGGTWEKHSKIVDRKSAPEATVVASVYYEYVPDAANGENAQYAGYIPPPKSLPGFPGAERIRPKGGRPRWRLPDGDIGEWDGRHGELERYNPRGKHKGVWDPDGNQIKDPVPGRKIDPYWTPSFPSFTPEQIIAGGLIIGGATIIIIDIITVPSGEGLIGVEMIRQAVH